MKFDLGLFLEKADRHHSEVSGAPACLYVISCPGHVKIGIAGNPKQRLVNLQSASPFKLRLEYAVQMRTRTAAALAERTCHDMLQQHSASGEWFALSAEEVWPLVDGICRHAGVLCDLRDRHVASGGNPTDRKFKRTLRRLLRQSTPRRAVYAHFHGL